MEFVVYVLEQFFDMEHEAARELMLRIHREGVAECGTYTYEEAQTKAAGVAAFAREHRHPLQCQIERKTDA
jgi:ATP-dependent Clp protease adaptor protein ClpS